MRDITRKLQVLSLRKKGLSYSEIGKILGVSKQNVHSIEKRARRQFEECKLTCELLSWAFAKECIMANKGTDMKEVVEKLFSVADKYGMKLPGTFSEIMGFIKVKLGQGEDVLKRSCMVCLLNDGVIEVISEEALEVLRQLNLVDENQNA